MKDSNKLIETIHRFARAFHHYSMRGGRRGHGGMRFRGQGRALEVLRDNPNSSQKDLAELLAIRPQSVSELLAKLERHGLIRRAESENDRRAVEIALTESGREAAAGETTEKTEEADILDCLSEEEKDSLGVLLGKLADRLERELAEPGPAGGVLGRPFGPRGLGRGGHGGDGRAFMRETRGDGEGRLGDCGPRGRGRGGRREGGHGRHGAPSGGGDDRGEPHRTRSRTAGCPGDCGACGRCRGASRSPYPRRVADAEA